MIGKIINSWKIIKKSDNNPRAWVCECTCSAHTQKEMRLDEMQSSKGCTVCSIAKNKFQKLTGQKFGHWTVLYRVQSQGCHTMWHCKCDCAAGTEHDIDGYALRTGKSLSCGCDSRSNGERSITYLLNKNNILFEQEKSFDSCKMKKYGKLRFDFYVNNQYLIEFDGEQHFIEREKGWNDPEKLKKTQERDAFKNQWCKKNNIPLIRIPYWHIKKLCIEDLLLETSEYIVK